MSNWEIATREGDFGVDDVVVVIRSANERTGSLCKELAVRQVPAERVVVIRERPFSAALRRAFEVGLDFGLKWTICLDADVLLSKDALRKMVAAAESEQSSIFGATGFVLDKFYGSKNRGGPHMYRTALFRKALPMLVHASVSLRPETHVKLAMNERGHEWATVDDLLGIHDFEQFYCDIYRKMIVRARKSSQNAARLLERAVAQSTVDTDFLVGAWGLRVGMERRDTVELDAEQWTGEARTLLIANGIAEKSELVANDHRGLADSILADHLARKGPRELEGAGRATVWRRKIAWHIASRRRRATGNMRRLVTRLASRLQQWNAE